MEIGPFQRHLNGKNNSNGNGKDAEHEDFARLSVKSFLDQTYSNKKLLIIDGEYSLSDLNCNEVEEIKLDIQTENFVSVDYVSTHLIICQKTIYGL